MAKQNTSFQTRWGFLTEEELKIVELLSSDTPRIGYEMLKRFTRGRIAMMLDKTVFQGLSNAKNQAGSGPNLGVRFIVYNSLFSLNLQHCTFDSACLSTRNLWYQVHIDADHWKHAPDKDGELVWYVYDYKPDFCKKLGITRISVPV